MQCTVSGADCKQTMENLFSFDVCNLSKLWKLIYVFCIQEENFR